MQDLVRGMHPGAVASLIGVSATIWHRWDPKPPHELREFDEKVAPGTDNVLFPATGGDLFLFVKANRADLCFEVHVTLQSMHETHTLAQVTKRVIAALGDNVASWDQTLSFGYMGGPYGGKDLTGYVVLLTLIKHWLMNARRFIDGTRNPDHLLRAVVDEVVIFPDDDPEPNPAHCGGTYMYAGRFVHDLKKVFSSLL